MGSSDPGKTHPDKEIAGLRIKLAQIGGNFDRNEWNVWRSVVPVQLEPGIGSGRIAFCKPANPSLQS